MFKLFKYLPFSYMWFLRILSNDPKTVLDIGCNNGKLMGIIADKNWEITGIDIHEKSLKKAKKRGIYKDLIKGDLIIICNRLLKEGKKYDLVFCSQVIEHISRKEGKKLLDLAEKLSKKRIYFGTPRGFMGQPEAFVKDNPYQLHKSGWTISDFTSRGFKVYGVGFYPVWSEHGWGRSKNKFLLLLSTLLGYIFSPITYFFPAFGSGIMAIKEK